MYTWEFDDYPYESTSHISLSDTEYGQIIKVNTDQKSVLKIFAHRDMWGTWITFQIGESEITIAQEDETKSFMTGLIDALQKLKGITDIGTQAPIFCDLSNQKG